MPEQSDLEKQLAQKVEHLRDLYSQANPVPINPKRVTPVDLVNSICWLAKMVLDIKANDLLALLNMTAQKRDGYAPEEHAQHFMAEVDAKISELMSTVQKQEAERKEASGPKVKTYRKVPPRIPAIPGTGRLN